MRHSITEKLFPACSTCGSALTERVLFIISSECWKCQSPLKVAAFQIGYTFYPEDFAKDERDAALRNGVVLKEQFSRTEQRNYMGNTCPACDALQGNWYVGEALSDYVGVPREEITMGFACWECRKPVVK